MFKVKKRYNKCVMRKKYEIDLTEEQWEVIAHLFSNMRKYKWEKRELVNAVLLGQNSRIPREINSPKT